MRDGEGKEMNENGRVVFVGEWKEGKRNGVGEEMTGMGAIGHWKDGKKDGMVYERDETGVMKRGCFYENGEMKRVVQEFDDTTMVEYDENGRKVFEGGFCGGVENGFVRDGFGKEFRMVEEKMKSISEPTTEIEKKRFCCWVRDIEHEVAGVELVSKRYREEMVEGAWCNGVRVISTVIPSSLTSNPLKVEELRIGNNSYNDSSVTEFKLSGLVQLKRIVTGDECFGSVRVVELDGLRELESVVIGQRSFTYAKTDYDIRYHVTRTDGVCRIVNCPKLKSIQIGDWSFSDYHSFELNNLPSLQSIDIGRDCFFYSSSFSLIGLID